jgi:hypothetical protein
MSIQPTAQRPVDMAAPQAPTSREQPKLAPNTIYAEGLGAGGVYSLNYERLVIDDLAVRAGFSYISMSLSAGSSSASASLLTIPITASYIGVRSGKHALELGGGATLTSASAAGRTLGSSASSSGLGAFGSAMVGYRIHPLEGAGFNFRIGAAALMGKGMSLSSDGDPNAFGMLPWFYISMGASF